MKRASLEDRVRVLYKDDALLVLAKPAGLETTRPTPGPCLVRAARRLDPRAELNHPTSRLDSLVSGIVIFARDRAANQAIHEARGAGEYHRLYLGLGSLPRGLSLPLTIENEIGIDPANPRRRLIGGGGSRKPAKSEINRRASATHADLLELRPFTGRTHQLRLHAAHIGAPLFGDIAYGGPRRVILADGRVVHLPRVMLHAFSISIPHPRNGERVIFELSADEDFQRAFEALGGERADLLSAPDGGSSDASRAEREARTHR